MDNLELMRRLDQDGATGADLSPGDPVCAAAALRIRELEKTLQAVKRRMHFIGSPAEAVWSPNENGHTNPDWRHEIALVEHSLNGGVLAGLARSVAQKPALPAMFLATKPAYAGRALPVAARGNASAGKRRMATSRVSTVVT